MTSIKNTITDLFKTTIQSTFGCEIDPLIQLAGRPEFGDYQANFALRLAKQLQKKPVEIAGLVIEKLISQDPQQNIFAKLESSGPGFINITLSNAWLAHHLQNLVKDARLGIHLVSEAETVIVDYSSPNVAKEMHVGHLRSAIIGDAIVRLLAFVGHRVIRQNHLGDWGTQFGMLIENLIQSGWEKTATHRYGDLNTLYKKSKELFEADPAFAEKARKRVVALQNGDPTTLAIWQQLVDESKHYFQDIYHRLGILLTEQDACGESFYNHMLADVTTALEQQGVAVIDQGALVIFLEGFTDPNGNPFPFLIRKSDGGYLYATTDIAAIKHRVQALQGDRLIYVVDARQKQHFAILFAAAQKAGLLRANTRLEHISYGSILGEDHKPFKTRSGETIKLVDLLDEAEKRSAKIVAQKRPDLTATELSAIAKDVGIGALKYADLRNDKVKDYVFSWDKMLAFDGNTGPYLQNAYVRICSIFRKGRINSADLSSAALQITTPLEHILAVKIAQFPDVINSITDHLNMHCLCEYLYDLAGVFHKFYEHCPILSDENLLIRDSRLLLCDLTARTLQLGLNLLGINVLEKM